MTPVRYMAANGVGPNKVAWSGGTFDIAASLSMGHGVFFADDSTQSDLVTKLDGNPAVQRSGGAGPVFAPNAPVGFTGIPVVQDNPALNTPFLNTFGRPIEVSLQVGVISVPGDNGHFYLDSNAPDFSIFNRQGFVACRDLLTGTALAGSTGVGGILRGVIPTGWLYQFTTEIIAGNPTFITITSPLPARTIVLR